MSNSSIKLTNVVDNLLVIGIIKDNTIYIKLKQDDKMCIL